MIKRVKTLRESFSKKMYVDISAARIEVYLYIRTAVIVNNFDGVDSGEKPLSLAGDGMLPASFQELTYRASFPFHLCNL